MVGRRRSWEAPFVAWGTDGRGASGFDDHLSRSPLTFRTGPDSRRYSTSVNATSGDPKVERLWTETGREQIQRGAGGGSVRHRRPLLLRVKVRTPPAGFGPLIVLVAWVLTVGALAALALTS
jgi:hypothetical protein